MSPTPRKKKAARRTGRKHVARRPRRRAAAKPTGVRSRATPKRRRPARRPARKSAARKTAPRKPATRKSTPRKAARKPARRAAPKPARRKRRPALRVVRAPRPVRPARPTTPPPGPFPQRAGATPKQLVLFELIRARAALLAAIHGLSPGGANEPMGEGRWNIREIVLHLITRDQARLRESESTLHGQSASWKGIRDPEMGALNAELMTPLHHLDWEEALRTLSRVREQLMEEIESVPEEPAEVWSPEHPFGWMLQALPPHDRHHADIIKRWRVERGV